MIDDRHTHSVHIVTITGDTAQHGLIDYAKWAALYQQRGGAGADFLSNCEEGTLLPPPEWPNILYGAEMANPQAPLTAEETQRRFPQDALTQYLRTVGEVTKRRPVLIAHVGDRAGMQTAPETLRRVPSIVIAHEFQSVSYPERKANRLELLAAAGQILFTSKAEYEAVIFAMKDRFGERQADDFSRRCKLYPVPSNIHLSEGLKHPQERKADIVVFGMIWKNDKGLESIPEIARAMKADPHFKGRAIRVVGGVRHDRPSGVEMIRELLSSAFGFSLQDMQTVAPKDVLALASAVEGNEVGNLPPSAAEFLRAQGCEVREGVAAKRQLPIHFHLNQTNQQISQILAENRYGLLLMKRGATNHSGTLAAYLQHKMITLARSCSGDQTPKTLSNGSIYLLNGPDAALEEIKTHEARAAEDPAYENAMIRKGDFYREQRSWEGLARTIADMATEAVAAHDRRQVTGIYTSTNAAQFAR